MADPVLASRQILTADATVTGLVAQRISTIIPPTPTWPLIRLSSLGGSGLDEIDGRRDIRSVRIEAWGAKTDESDTALADLEAVVDAVRAAFQAVSEAGATVDAGVIARARELSAPAWVPDPTDNRPRFTWTEELTILEED